MMSFVKRLYCLLLFLSLVGLLTSCTSTFPSAAVEGKMVLIAPNVFVDKAMPIAHQQQFLYNLSTAKQKIQRFFGSMQANPVIYACFKPNCERLLGGLNVKASAYGDSHVLFTARGLDPITIAHELTHIELHKRIGNKQAWHKLPFWFDEGLAVLVAEDPRYNDHQWHRIIGHQARAVALNNLVTEQQWIYAVKQGQWPYGIARKAVKNWYTNQGHQALESLIVRLRQGQNFTLAGDNAVFLSKRL